MAGKPAKFSEMMGDQDPEEPEKRHRKEPRAKQAGKHWQTRKIRGAEAGNSTDPEQVLRQVSALIDAPVHGHKALQARLVPDIGIVKAGVQHDHSEGQHVAGVYARENKAAGDAPGPSQALCPEVPIVWEARSQALPSNTV